MGKLELLSSVELFEGLTQDELALVESLCYQRTFQANEVIAQQNSYGDELYIIQDGFVEVAVDGQGGDGFHGVMACVPRGAPDC